MTATAMTVEVDRAALERFYVDVFALMFLEKLRFTGETGGVDTPFVRNIDGILGRFDRDAGVWDLDDDAEGERHYELGLRRAREVHVDLLRKMLADAEGGDDA